ncbi:MAG: hypothetical protein K0S23_864 [Fluviicola sp.]|jgi:hypothetical protein|uniref:WG repeat-containing protein n=1 Tax=Fluviicola sp. TaxID=1917219 RepID=UPI002603A241|nr:WG repeat-containing protein [Fluviicola sp.]MDF3026557.1 hypothetical protein [Fluviicola sp.]
MNRLVFCVIATLSFLSVHAQPFKYDEFGHVGDSKFKAFITNRGYKLVGRFYQISVGKKSIIAAKVLKGTKWTFIDVNGKEIESPGEKLRIEQNIPEMGHPDAFHGLDPGPNDWKSEKFQGFNTTEGRGLIYDGDTLVQAIYQEVTIYSADHLFVVKKNNKYGVINKKGILVIPLEYESLSPIGSNATSEFFYYAKKDGKAGIISEDNRVTIPFEFEQLNFKKTYFETNIRVKGKPNNRGVIDLKGKEIIPCIYTGIVGDYDGFYIVSKGRSNKDLVVGMTDLNGKFILDTIYSEYYKYGNNDSNFLIQFNQREKPNSSRTTSGIYDLRLKQFVLSPGKYSVSRIVYQYGRDVHIKTNSGYLHGWAGKSGKLLIEPIYEELSATWDSPFLIVKKDGKYGVVDSLGKVILPIKYEGLDHFGSFSFETDIKRGDVFVITEGAKQGIINTKEKILIPIEYESIETTSSGIICKKEGHTKIMNLDGRVYYETSELNIGEFDLEYGFIKTPGMRYDLYGNKPAPVK